MGEKSRSGSRIRTWDEHPSYFRELRNNFLGQKYLNSLMLIWIWNPGSRIRIRDPRIRDKHPASATLMTTKLTKLSTSEYCISLP
jgi:hypothetical protein